MENKFKTYYAVWQTIGKRGMQTSSHTFVSSHLPIATIHRDRKYIYIVTFFETEADKNEFLSELGVV